jgi:hypothetical protein
VVYTDDTIVTGPNSKKIDRTISDISKQFVITHDPMVSDFLGVMIERDKEEGTYTLTQPHLIQSIITDLGLQGENTKTRGTKALSSKILQRHENSMSHSDPWHYRSVIGKLNYLEKCSRPDIA